MDKVKIILTSLFILSAVNGTTGTICNFTLGSASDSWRLNDFISVTFIEEYMTLTDLENTIIAEYTCQGVTGSGQFSQVDWTYHVVSSVDGSSQMCLRLYVTDALIVLWQSPPGIIPGTSLSRSGYSPRYAGSSTLLAVDCREIVTYAPPPTIFLKGMSIRSALLGADPETIEPENIDLASSACFASVPGLYQVVFDDGSGQQCEDDLGSVAEIVSGEIIINTCYAGNNTRLPLRNAARLKCAGPIESSALDDPWTETAVVLQYENEDATYYYCARIYIDMSQRRFQMSLDYTDRPDGVLKCEKGVSARLAQPDPMLQPELVGLDFLALEFTPADCDLGVCRNGGTCTQLFGRPSYECACAQGYSGDSCQVFNPCEAPIQPCENGGTCLYIEHEVHMCQCPTNFTGNNCEALLDICLRLPYTCDNGGTCLSVDDFNYTCACALPFTDTFCQTELFGCELDGCENGGTCTENATCECGELFEGSRCDVAITIPEERARITAEKSKNRKKKEDLTPYIVLIPIFGGLAIIFFTMLAVYLICYSRSKKEDDACETNAKRRNSIQWYSFRPTGPKILNRSSKKKSNKKPPQFNHDRPRLKTWDEVNRERATVPPPMDKERERAIITESIEQERERAIKAETIERERERSIVDVEGHLDRHSDISSSAEVPQYGNQQHHVYVNVNDGEDTVMQPGLDQE